MRIRKIEITDEVADVLRRGEWRGWLYFLPPGALDRKLYEAVDKVLRALGGRWHRGHRGHMFGLDAKAELVAALEAGGVVDQKKTMEQFFTPTELAHRMAVELGLADGIHVLEPSAGDGHLVQAAIAYGATVTAIELDEALIPRLNAAGDARFGWLRVYQADFMTWQRPQLNEAHAGVWFTAEIDRVMMNPPFGQGADMAHVLKAFGHLARGGRLAAIMSPHWTFATDRGSQEFRKLVENLGGRWEALPPGTFKSEGTMVNAGLLILDKPL